MKKQRCSFAKLALSKEKVRDLHPLAGEELGQVVGGLRNACMRSHTNDR
jgi:hypothetical protein